MTEREKKQLIQEVILLQTLSHGNVVRYVGKIVEREKSLLYLVMEFCDGGDLGRYLDHTVRKGYPLSENVVLDWFRQLVDALHYCHTRPNGKVLHRDLKPQNILLNSKFNRLKLADFGLAKLMKPQQAMAETHVGTPFYMSPEVLNRQQYDEKSDIWALGCLLFEIMTGASPFSKASSYDHLCTLVQSGSLKVEQRNAVPSLYCSELVEIVLSMLSYEPVKRPTATELKKSVVYRLADSLRFEELSNHLTTVVAEQQSQLQLKIKELCRLRTTMNSVLHDLSFLAEYVTFQKESDADLKKTMKLLTTIFTIKNENENP